MAMGLTGRGFVRARWRWASGVALLVLLELVVRPAAAVAGPPPVMRAAPATYVALGDSYASGEGVEPFLPGTDDSRHRCHPSAGAYARLLAAGPGMPPVAEFWACSGARVADFIP